MIRFAILTIPALAMIAACSAPVETRISTRSASALPQPREFTFTPKPEQDGQIYAAARDLVAAALKAKGFGRSETAPVRVSIAMADRPASIAISAGEGDDLATIADIKERKPLQSCEDQEHRLTVLIADQVSGTAVYSGTAAEYHCKGTFEESLPHLVKAALSDLGANSPGERMFVRKRPGVE